MKKVLFSVLFLASVLYAAAPTAFSYGIEVWDYNIVDTIEAANDTLTADGDSSVLFSNFVPESGWRYRLGRAAISGTGADSVVVRIILRPEDFNNVPICTVAVDTFTAAAGEYIEIPFGTYPGKQYDIVAEGDGDIGTQVILNRMQLFRVRPIFSTGKYRE
jgi:hypothetical protein